MILDYYHYGIAFSPDSMNTYLTDRFVIETVKFENPHSMRKGLAAWATRGHADHEALTFRIDVGIRARRLFERGVEVWRGSRT